jgi:hypothetical protein
MTDRDLSDGTILRILREALDEEPPAGAVAVALGAPELVGLREELASLDYDSLVDDDALLVRASDQRWRSASFSFGDVTLDIEILDDERTVVGLLLPPEPAEVEIRQFDANYVVTTDESGRFSCVIAPGPVQLRIRRHENEIVTAWLTR